MNINLNVRITLDPKIMAGKPVIRGTRIPVDMIVRMIAQGMAESEIIAEYPQLIHEDIKAALIYAAEVVSDEEVFPIAATA